MESARRLGAQRGWCLAVPEVVLLVSLPKGEYALAAARVATDSQALVAAAVRAPPLH